MNSIIAVLLYMAGALTSVGPIHEGAHMAVAQIQGVDIHWDGGQWTTDGHASDSLRMAGVLAQALTSEAILAFDLQDRSPYFKGMLHANIIHTGTYASLRGGGDFNGMGSVWHRGIALHAGSVAARTLGNRIEVRDGGIFYTWRW